MGRWAALFLVLAAVPLGGCLREEPIKRSEWTERFRRFNFDDSANIVQIEVRLIERPAADRYLNIEVWKHTDPWVLDSEEETLDFNRRALVEKNGFRIGQVVGALPSKLHFLLTSERSCVNPECLVREVGKETPVRLTPLMGVCRFQMNLEDDKSEFELPQAQCRFRLVAVPTADGRTRLRFTPCIEYGEYQNLFEPASDRSDWVLKTERPSKSFPQLSWEVTLADNELLLIGTSLEHPTSLGFQAFVDRSTRTPVQRLLVLRVVRSGASGVDAELPNGTTAPPNASRPLPLAVQASKTRARSSRK